MIVKKLRNEEVLETAYPADGGGIGQMILDRRASKEIGFMAIVQLEPGKQLEAHVDPMEETCFIMSGEGSDPR